MTDLDQACPDCGATMVKRDGKFGPFLGCSLFPQCRGTIACNDKGELTAKPANAETRAARMEAHRYFDRLWKTDGVFKNRRAAYAWMKRTMQLMTAEAHIAQFDLKQCQMITEYAKLELKMAGVKP